MHNFDFYKIVCSHGVSRKHLSARVDDVKRIMYVCYYRRSKRVVCVWRCGGWRHSTCLYANAICRRQY